MIQKRLSGMNEDLSLPSIRRVLFENGILGKLNFADNEMEQIDLFTLKDEGQLFFQFSEYMEKQVTLQRNICR